MPELPEVETTLRGITPHLKGHIITGITIRNAKLRVPVTEHIEHRVTQQKITHLSRRAKYIIIHLTEGYLLIHLGMSGHLKVVASTTEFKTHDHIDLILDSNHSLRFNDPRRFGLFLYLDRASLEQHKLFSHLGPEPLSSSFNTMYLFQKSRNRKTPIKSFIMDNTNVVGVGNIYATESLFLAKIHPLTQASQLNQEQCTQLVAEIKKVLSQAIEVGGTTLRDFYGADGNPGYFNLSLHVYGRQHQPCLKCQAVIQAIVIGGRRSAFCPECQAFPVNTRARPQLKAVF